VKGRLNLATRRFRNERVPVLGFSLLGIVLLVVSVQHALVVRRLLPSHSSALQREVASLEAEEARLRKESADLRGGPPPEKARVEEWQFVKDLVDRRVFRWTQLFATLAQHLPRDLRLTGITPELTKGTVKLQLNAAMQSMDSGLAFIKTLEEQPEFQDVYPQSVGETPRSGEKEFTYVMLYLADPAGPAPAPAAKEAGK
jgi:Tfp pilus assembly protein PilN